MMASVMKTGKEPDAYAVREEVRAHRLRRDTDQLDHDIDDRSGGKRQKHGADISVRHGTSVIRAQPGSPLVMGRRFWSDPRFFDGYRSQI